MVFQKKENYVEAKPGFDGRLAFINIMEKAMENWLDASANNNQTLQFKALQQLHVLVCPYIKTEFNKDITNLLSRIKLNLQRVDSNKTIRWIVEDDLTTVSYNLFNYGKHILLPQDVEDQSDPDWDAEAV
jgi:hypothetical protein